MVICGIVRIFHHINMKTSSIGSIKVVKRTFELDKANVVHKEVEFGKVKALANAKITKMSLLLWNCLSASSS